jgi:hypothetical protein
VGDVARNALTSLGFGLMSLSEQLKHAKLEEAVISHQVSHFVRIEIRN